MSGRRVFSLRQHHRPQSCPRHHRPRPTAAEPPRHCLSPVLHYLSSLSLFVPPPEQQHVAQRQSLAANHGASSTSSYHSSSLPSPATSPVILIEDLKQKKQSCPTTSLADRPLRPTVKLVGAVSRPTRHNFARLHPAPTDL